MKTNPFHAVFLGIIYVAASVVIGEQHPFTRVPMYNDFPEYAYSFYVSNAEGNLLPFTNYFACKNDYPAHLYGTICEKNKINSGYELETDSQLYLIGKSMLNTLKKQAILPLPKGEVQIHRVCYFKEKELIKNRDKKMYSEFIR